jgi:hypothetical protein
MTTSFAVAGHRWLSSLKFVGGNGEEEEEEEEEEKRQVKNERKKEKKREGDRHVGSKEGKFKNWKRGTMLSKKIQHAV